MSGLAETFGRVHDLAAEAVAAAWFGDRVLFALGEGEIAGVDGDGTLAFRRRTHEGALLAAASGRDVLVAAGDDGRVAAVKPSGEVTWATAFAGRFIDALAASPTSGLAAVGVDKQAVVLGPHGASLMHLDHEARVIALGFDALGRRLAAAHYGGVTLSWASNPDGKRKSLAWKGAHTSVQWSPTGKYVVTTMQENALHGWRLQDGAHFRMAGYPSKIRSLAFSPDGAWLASAGAPAVLCWPFAGPSGPVNREAAVIGELEGPCTAVACNPKLPLVAAGSTTGEVGLFPLGRGANPALIDAAGAGRITALAWSADGRRLAFAAEGGRAAIVDFAAFAAAD